MKEFLYAIIASVIITLSVLIRKYALKNNNASDIAFFLFCGMIISAIIIAVILNNNNKNAFKNIDNDIKLLTIISGILIPLGILSLTYSFKYVSNPAYTSIVFSAFKIILLLILSLYLFNSHCNKFTLFGIILALIGMILIIKFQ